MRDDPISRDRHRVGRGTRLRPIARWIGGCFADEDEVPTALQHVVGFVLTVVLLLGFGRLLKALVPGVVHAVREHVSPYEAVAEVEVVLLIVVALALLCGVVLIVDRAARAAIAGTRNVLGRGTQR
jgi:hypothetical protein